MKFQQQIIFIIIEEIQNKFSKAAPDNLRIPVVLPLPAHVRPRIHIMESHPAALTHQGIPQVNQPGYMTDLMQTVDENKIDSTPQNRRIPQDELFITVVSLKACPAVRFNDV